MTNRPGTLPGRFLRRSDMDREKRRELAEAYKTRRPDMGVVAIRCTATGSTFFGASKDIGADINSNRFKLSSGSHRNRELMALWREHGEDAFEFNAERILEYEDPSEDHSEELALLTEECLESHPGSKRIWR